MPDRRIFRGRSVRMAQLGPEHWLNRAEEARVMAEGMKDPETRAAMLRIAAEYEAIAERVSKWATAPFPRAQKPEPEPIDQLEPEPRS